MMQEKCRVCGSAMVRNLAGYKWCPNLLCGKVDLPEPPLVKGGQGRTDEDALDEADAQFWFYCGAACAGILILAVYALFGDAIMRWIGS